MSKRPSEGIGKRLATYRRMAGYSARELADLAGWGLTRGVIANIESGRKSDITVDQLIALSAVLAIPPAALALPVDDPFRFVRLHGGSGPNLVVRSYLVTDWFQGEGTWFRTPKLELGESPSTRFATDLVKRVREYAGQVDRVLSLRIKVDNGEIDQEVLDEAEAELGELKRVLRQLEANPALFTLDDEEVDESIEDTARDLALLKRAFLADDSNG